MTKKKPQQRKLELPSDALRVIGPQNLLSLSTPAYNPVLKTLDRIYREKGLEGIKKQKAFLIDSLKGLKMF